MEEHLISESSRIQAKLDKLDRDMTVLVHTHIQNRKLEFRKQISEVRAGLSELKTIITKGERSDPVVTRFIDSPEAGIRALNESCYSLNFSLEEVYDTFRSMKLVDLRPISETLTKAYLIHIYIEMQNQVRRDLSLYRSSTIYDVKEAYAQVSGLSFRSFQLKSGDQVLESCRRLEELNVPDEAVLTAETVDSSRTVIFIEPSQQPKFAVDFDLNDSVSALKARISVYMEVPAEKQRLIYMSRLLNDKDTVAACGIKPNSTVFLAFSSHNLLDLVVKLPSGKLLTTTAAGSDTVAQVKERLVAFIGIQSYNQHLFSDGKELANKRTLLSYEIQNDAMLEIQATETGLDSLTALQGFVKRKLLSFLK